MFLCVAFNLLILKSQISFFLTKALCCYFSLRFVFQTSPAMCGCSQSTKLLLWKALFRVIAFFVLASTGGLIFSIVERPNARIKAKTKDELLDSLRTEMEKKYNMTQSDFDNFTQTCSDALGLDGPDWSFFDGVRYAFETLTTIGKYNTQSSQKFLGTSYIQNKDHAVSKSFTQTALKY